MESIVVRLNKLNDKLHDPLREVWGDTNFTDVTLATSDGQQLRAHKVILASSSPFFKQLLLANPHPSPLVYLRGLAFREVEQVLRMLYLGEVEVLEEQLEAFMRVARDLGIANLFQENNQEDMFEKIDDSANEPQIFKVEGDFSEKTRSGLLALKTSNKRHSAEKNPKASGENIALKTTEEAHSSPLEETKDVNDEAEPQNVAHGETKEVAENEIRSKSVEFGDEPFFICDVCNQGFKSNHRLNKHKEIKHDGVRYECDKCDFQAATRNYLKHHKNFIHEGISYNCEFCEIQFTAPWTMKKHIERKHTK